MADRNTSEIEPTPVLERQLHELDACFAAFRHVMARSMTPPATDIELSPQDFRALVILAESGRLTMTDFAEQLRVPLSTATRIVERLIDKGLAVRSRIEDDRRVVRVEIDEEGKKLYQKFLEQRRAIGRSMLSALTHGEREIFIELMAKISRQRPAE